MKLKLPLWMVALPIIFCAAGLQLIYDFGERGTLHSDFLRRNFYNQTRSVNGILTNFKFKTRGPEAPKNKIVIVEADDQSVEHFGRWPWHREIYAQLIYSIFKEGAKQVAIDIGFSEPEERIPKEVYDLIKTKNPNLIPQIREFEGDPTFAKVIKAYQKQLILGFSPIAICQPGYRTIVPDPDCPIENAELSKEISGELDKFALNQRYPFSSEKMNSTPLINIMTAFSNIEPFRDAALYAGSFSITPDNDGYIRRYPLFQFNRDRIYPSLAMRSAMLARDDEIKIDFSEKTGLVEKVYFSRDPDHPIPVTGLGNTDLNFRGPGYTFTYVSALDVLKAFAEPNAEIAKTLKDAYVFFGVSAVGIYDMRSFPFDSNVPGVEGHATALDNLLSNDSLRSANNIGLGWLPVAMVVLLGMLFAYLFSKFEAVPSLLIFGGFFSFFGYVDVKLLFSHNINFPSAFLLIEILLIFALILSLRYILEERNKKFVREAFSKYLAPSVVDLVLKDPSKLMVGGERKEITIVFSDLRGFTTFSEKMDPKTLSQFLNEYLSEMTEIVFQYEGTLDKYIGDAVMAFWGAPLHQDNHASLAWQAAVAMQKRLVEIAPIFKAKYDIEVNSGEVSVGNMGSTRIFEYTVIGDHVNLASRLESLTRLYGCDILSTNNTVNAIPPELRKDLHYRKIDSVIVKGKTQAVDLIQVSIDPISEKVKEEFSEAQRAFRNRDWDRAKELYLLAGDRLAKDTGKPDPVADVFAKRCDEYKEYPPGENWDGTIEMRRK
jgi:adenylate cyclase